MSKELEVCYAGRLLLDLGKGCPYRGIQATDKTGEEINQDFVCVK